MQNLLFKICYDGTRYHGYQVQKNALSVMTVIQDAIEKFTGIREPIVGCSRTDSGVHANEYYFHMKTELDLPPRAFVFGLNHVLPRDIVVLSCEPVPLEFHARYSARRKQYIYRIYNAPIRSPFYEGRALHYPGKLNDQLLDREAKAFLGTHDFAAFCSAGSKIRDTVRTIYTADVSREGDLVTFTVTGNGFLYHMVRIMAGTLLKINEGRLQPGQLPEVIASGNRLFAGKTAPAHGLYLNRVDYLDD